MPVPIVTSLYQFLFQSAQMVIFKTYLNLDFHNTFLETEILFGQLPAILHWVFSSRQK